MGPLLIIFGLFVICVCVGIVGIVNTLRKNDSPPTESQKHKDSNGTPSTSQSPTNEKTKSFFSRPYGLFATVLLFNVAALSLMYWHINEQISEMSYRISSLNDKIYRVSDNLSGFDGYGGLESDVSFLKSRISSLESKVSAMDSEISYPYTGLKSKVSRLESEINQLKYALRPSRSIFP